MGYVDQLRNQQNTAENFIDTTEPKQVLIRDFENLRVRNNTLVVERENLGDSTTNYFLMISDGETDARALMDGSRQFVEPDVPYVRYRVVNDNNTHYELFTTQTFNDTSTTTGSWSDGVLELDDGELARSQAIFSNNQVVRRARMTVYGDNTDGLTLKLSAFNNSSFETVTNRSLHKFTTLGTTLKWQIENDSGSTITITKVVVTYEV